jgi:hypothetical protein
MFSSCVLVGFNGLMDVELCMPWIGLQDTSLPLRVSSEVRVMLL